MERFRRRPVRFAGEPLAGYNLPSTVAGIIAAVDGEHPAPQLLRTTLASTPGTMELVPDNRGKRAIVVDLTVVVASSPNAVAAVVSRNGVPLTEGSVPSRALALSSTALGGLPAPIILGAQNPLRVQLSAMPGATDPASAATAQAAVFYCSDRAAEEVRRLLGEQRWLGVSTLTTSTAAKSASLNVQRAAHVRSTYVLLSGTTTVNLFQRNGRSLIGGTWTGITSAADSILGNAFFAQPVDAGDIFSLDATTTSAPAATDFFSVVLAGPSWAY